MSIGFSNRINKCSCSRSYQERWVLFFSRISLYRITLARCEIPLQNRLGRRLMYVPGRNKNMSRQSQRLLCLDYSFCTNCEPMFYNVMHQWGQANGPGTAERPIEQKLTRGISCAPVWLCITHVAGLLLDAASAVRNRVQTTSKAYTGPNYAADRGQSLSPVGNAEGGPNQRLSCVQNLAAPTMRRKPLTEQKQRLDAYTLC